jgi:nucleoside 2-deoxyribosyltransferase
VKTLYLAGPLFSNADRAENYRLADVLKRWFCVYLPQADGALLPNLLKEGVTRNAASRQIFDDDVAAVRACDIFLIVLNGMATDEGAAFELGIAWILGKPCFGFTDDFRRIPPSEVNPMVECALQAVFTSMGELKSWSETFAGSEGDG